MVNYIPTLDREITKSCLVGFHLIDRLDPSLPDEERILNRIYETLMLGDASMRTYRGRFEELDREILNLVHSFEPQRTIVKIHDIAASNAITSVELYEKVARISDRIVHVAASDICTKIDVHPVSPRWKVINYADPKCRAQKGWIQAVGKTVVVNENLPLKKVQYSRLKLARNWILRAYVALFVIPRYRKKKPAAEKRVSLFHPEAVRLAEQDERFQLWQYDLLDLPPGQFDIVRAMTILGRFKGRRFEIAVRSLAESVTDGGYLIVGFGKRECSIFRKAGDMLVHHKDVVAPSQLKGAIESIFAQA